MIDEQILAATIDQCEFELQQRQNANTRGLKYTRQTELSDSFNSLMDTLKPCKDKKNAERCPNHLLQSALTTLYAYEDKNKLNTLCRYISQLPVDRRIEIVNCNLNEEDSFFFDCEPSQVLVLLQLIFPANDSAECLLTNRLYYHLLAHADDALCTQILDLIQTFSYEQQCQFYDDFKAELETFKQDCERYGRETCARLFQYVSSLEPTKKFQLFSDHAKQLSFNQVINKPNRQPMREQAPDFYYAILLKTLTTVPPLERTVLLIRYMQTNKICNHLRYNKDTVQAVIDSLADLDRGTLKLLFSAIFHYTPKTKELGDTALIKEAINLYKMNALDEGNDEPETLSKLIALLRQLDKNALPLPHNELNALFKLAHTHNHILLMLDILDLYTHHGHAKQIKLHLTTIDKAMKQQLFRYIYDQDQSHTHLDTALNPNSALHKVLSRGWHPKALLRGQGRGPSRLEQLSRYRDQLHEDNRADFESQSIRYQSL